jgi:hypothetical protein
MYLTEGLIRRPEGGSEWESIKILLEWNNFPNKTNSVGHPKSHVPTQPFVYQNHVATEVLLVLGTNTTSSLNSYTHSSGNDSGAGCLKGTVRPGMGAIRPPPPGDREILQNSSSEHQNAPWFHQQKSLVKAKLATRKSCRKPKLHKGA